MEIGKVACAAPAWSYRGCTLKSKNVIVINEKQYGKIINDRPVTEIFALSC